MKFQLHPVQGQRFAVLACQRVGRFGEDPVELLRRQLLELHLDRKPAEQLREHAVLDQLFHPQPGSAHAAAGASESDQAVHLHLVEVGEGTGADEEDVAGVDLHEIMLVPVLRDVEGHEDLAPFEQFQQGLLHAFAADVAAAGAGAGAARAAGDLVDLVDEDDPALGGVDRVPALEKQLRDHHLHVLAVVASFRIFSGVHDGERHLEQLRELARDVRFS